VRMSCSTNDNDATEEEYIVVNRYTLANFHYGLLGSTFNGDSYSVDPTLNSMGLSTVWHDNEIDTENAYHYLCDQETSNANGTSQFGFCYTDHLIDDGDSGDALVSLAFGTELGGDIWSPGFTMECGDMGTGALQNEGTVSIWIR